MFFNVFFFFVAPREFEFVRSQVQKVVWNRNQQPVPYFFLHSAAAARCILRVVVYNKKNIYRLELLAVFAAICLTFNCYVSCNVVIPEQYFSVFRFFTLIRLLFSALSLDFCFSKWDYTIPIYTHIYIHIQQPHKISFKHKFSMFVQHKKNLLKMFRDIRWGDFECLWCQYISLAHSKYIKFIKRNKNNIEKLFQTHPILYIFFRLHSKHRKHSTADSERKIMRRKKKKFRRVDFFFLKEYKI